MPGRGVEAQGGGTERGYRIGEVASVVGLTRQTLHLYVRLGLIRPIGTTAGGHRLFAGSVFRQIEDIRARNRTRTLREIARDLERRPRARGGRRS